MAKKWNLRLRQYEPYTLPAGWVCPQICEDMEMPINCASCGKQMTYGQGFTSRIIQTDGGMSYSVCWDCKNREWAAEKAAREEQDK